MVGRYTISTGEFEMLNDQEVTVYAARGYSGRGDARNNPLHTDAKGVGPLPVGVYRCFYIANHPGLGPDVFALFPSPGNRMYGRWGFYIHGDNPNHPGESSSGCIILARSSRLALKEFDLQILAVVPDPPSFARGLEHRT